MKLRLIAAAALIPVLLAVLFIAPPLLFSAVVGVVCAIGAYELLRGTGLVKHLRLIVYSVVMAFAVPVWCWGGMDSNMAQIGVLIFTALIFGEVLYSKGRFPIEKAAVCYIAALVVPYLLASLVRILGDGSNRSLILIPFILAYLADSGAYFIGSAFGRHKLAPTISPKKSVEGLAGGIIFAVVGMLVYCLIMDLGFHTKVSYLYAVTYGIVGSLCGTFGDLCFSVIKRQTGIKDYGNLIPGHGGVLDRFDSVIFVAPLTELLVNLLPILE